MSCLGWAAWLEFLLLPPGSHHLMVGLVPLCRLLLQALKEEGSGAPTLPLIHTSGAVDSGGGIHSSTGLC